MFDDKVYIIAELGVNHNGKLQDAYDLIEAASYAGADAAKLQLFDSEKLVSKDMVATIYQKKNAKGIKTQYELLKGLQLGFEEVRKLKDFSKNNNLDFIVSPFDIRSLQYLLDLGVDYIKIASGEIINAPLLWRAGKSRKKLILSTGMATLQEVETALAIVNHSLNSDREPRNLNEIWQFWSQKNPIEKLKRLVALLHCTSQYPTPLDNVNLKAIDTLKDAFECEVGYSDHTIGSLVSVAAVARGAKIIEKHLTLNKHLKGPDHIVSAEPDEFRSMVEQIRQLEKVIGDGQVICSNPEKELLGKVRQRIVALKGISKGEIISKDNITTCRSTKGLSAIHFWDCVGQEAARDCAAGDEVVFNKRLE